jgi:hypothetical protein
MAYVEVIAKKLKKLKKENRRIDYKMNEIIIFKPHRWNTATNVISN